MQHGQALEFVAHEVYIFMYLDRLLLLYISLKKPPKEGAPRVLNFERKHFINVFPVKLNIFLTEL